MKYSRVAFAVVLATTAVSISTWARADGSCSEWRAECRGTAIKKNHDPKTCDAAWNNCMKSGHWIGPDSGRDYGAVAKR